MQFDNSTDQVLFMRVFFLSERKKNIETVIEPYIAIATLKGNLSVSNKMYTSHNSSIQFPQLQPQKNTFALGRILKSVHYGIVCNVKNSSYLNVL